jgi:hypothetical protein
MEFLMSFQELFRHRTADIKYIKLMWFLLLQIAIAYLRMDEDETQFGKGQ